MSDWWFVVGLKVSTALARGKCCPAVRRKFAFHSRCAFAKCTLNVVQSRLRVIGRGQGSYGRQEFAKEKVRVVGTGVSSGTGKSRERSWAGGMCTNN